MMVAVTNDQEGPYKASIPESDPQHHEKDGLLGPNSIMAVHLDPLGQLGIVAMQQLVNNADSATGRHSESVSRSHHYMCTVVVNSTASAGAFPGGR